MVNRRVIYGQALELLRNTRKKSQRELAAALHTNKDAIGDMEHGERDITAEMVVLAAAYLRFNAARFLALTSAEPNAVMACLLTAEEEKEPG